MKVSLILASRIKARTNEREGIHVWITHVWLYLTCSAVLFPPLYFPRFSIYVIYRFSWRPTAILRNLLSILSLCLAPPVSLRLLSVSIILHSHLHFSSFFFRFQFFCRFPCTRPLFRSILLFSLFFSFIVQSRFARRDCQTDELCILLKLLGSAKFRFSIFIRVFSYVRCF